MKLLVADDDEDVLIIIKYCFAHVPNIELKCVASGEEAIAAALEMHPDIILLDVIMPKMDGVDTLKAMRLMPQLAQIPIIFLTAKAQKKEIEQYLQAGANDVIIKPFDPLALPKTVEKLWKRYRKAE